MKIHTASEVITFVRRLEHESAKLYETLSQRHPDHKDVFLSFAKENARNVVQIERAYYSVITDAIEGCFAFDIETDEYAIDTVLAEDASYPEALRKAAEAERTVVRFYTDAVEQSYSLMADVPRVFSAVAKRRGSRISNLELMSGASKA